MTQRRSDGRSERVIARRDFTKAVGITALGAITSGLGLFKPDIADADSAVQRPLSDFLGAQGTTTIFIPPVRDQGGWATNVSQPPVRFALVDYAGFEAEYLAANGISLGTTVTGSVTERPLADGRAEVQVILYTVKALTWAIEIDPNGPPSQYLSNPLLFGFRAQDLVADPTKSPALGESHLQFVFKNTAPGAPLPDLVVAFFVGPPRLGKS